MDVASSMATPPMMSSELAGSSRQNQLAYHLVPDEGEKDELRRQVAQVVLLSTEGYGPYQAMSRL